MQVEISSTKPFLSTIRQWWWVYFVLITPLILIQVIPWTLISIGSLFFLLHWQAHRKIFPSTPVKIPLHLLTSMVLISLWTTYDLSISLPPTLITLHGILLFWTLLYGMSSTRLTYASGLTILGMAQVALCLIALINADWATQHALLGPFLVPLTSIQSILPERLIELSQFNPNRIAGTLIWYVPTAIVFIALIFKYPKQLAQQNKSFFLILAPTILVTTPLLVLTLIITGSRSAYIGLALAVPVALCIIFFPNYIKHILIAGIGICIMVLTSVILSPRLQGWLFSGTSSNVGSLASRIELWAHTIWAIQDFTLTGIGMNTFPNIIHTLYPLSLISPTELEIHAHNELLSVTVELGIVGGIAYVAIWLAALFVLYQNWEKVDAPLQKGLNTALGCSFVAFLIFGLADSLAIGGRTSFLFWMLLASIFALHDRITKNGHG